MGVCTVCWVGLSVVLPVVPVCPFACCRQAPQRLDARHCVREFHKLLENSWVWIVPSFDRKSWDFHGYLTDFPGNSSALIGRCPFSYLDVGRMLGWIVPNSPRKSSDFHGGLTNPLGNSIILIARCQFFPGISGTFSDLARGHIAFVVDAQTSWGFPGIAWLMHRHAG